VKKRNQKPLSKNQLVNEITKAAKEWLSTRAVVKEKAKKGHKISFMKNPEYKFKTIN